MNATTIETAIGQIVEKGESMKKRQYKIEIVAVQTIDSDCPSRTMLSMNVYFKDPEMGTLIMSGGDKPEPLMIRRLTEFQTGDVVDEIQAYSRALLSVGRLLHNDSAKFVTELDGACKTGMPFYEHKRRKKP